MDGCGYTAGLLLDPLEGDLGGGRGGGALAGSLQVRAFPIYMSSNSILFITQLVSNLIR